MRLKIYKSLREHSTLYREEHQGGLIQQFRLMRGCELWLVSEGLDRRPLALLCPPLNPPPPQSSMEGKAQSEAAWAKGGDMGFSDYHLEKLQRIWVQRSLRYGCKLNRRESGENLYTEEMGSALFLHVLPSGIRQP